MAGFMAADRFWDVDPLPVWHRDPHPGFTAPHSLRCARWGCCKAIAFLTVDRRMPYLGFCAEHKTHLTNVPVSVSREFCDWPIDMRLAAAIADKQRRGAA